ncbi:MAG: long-chain acyl-CoA synthetase [Kiritimatiellia bacterium]
MKLTSESTALPPQALWPGAYQCLGDLLTDALIQFKSDIALIEVSRRREVHRLSYLDVWRRTRRVGHLLQAQDLGPGDRFAILMSNQSRWLISATAAMQRGMTLVPLDFKLSGAEHLALLEHAKPSALLIEYGLWRRLPDDLNVPMVLVSEAPAKADLGDALRFEDMQNHVDTDFVHISATRDDIACLVYSSGTGGTPKACQLTHGNYLAQWQALAQLYPMQQGDRFFSILPTNHAIDFMTGFIGPMACGGTVIHQRTLRPEFLLHTMRTYKITHMALVPLVLKAFRRALQDKLDDLSPWRRAAFDALVETNTQLTWRGPKHGLSSRLLKPIHDALGGELRFMFCGGSFVEKDLAEFFYRLGIPVVIGYGLTETCTVATVNDLRPFRADTVGAPLPGVDLRIDQPGDDGVGEVFVRGPTVFKGYLDAPELNEAAFDGDWLRTGDLGWLDASGHLRLVGRRRNMIVTEGGKNIYPEDIEAAFSDVPCEEMAVFATNYIWPKRAMVGEQLVVVLRGEGLQPTPEVLSAMRAANRRLPDFKRVSTILPWADDFPRTASMKLKRHELAATLRAHSDERLIQHLLETA